MPRFAFAARFFRGVAKPSVVTTILDAVGAAVVVRGVAFIYAPAAYIVAGIAVLAMSWASDPRPSKGDG